VLEEISLGDLPSDSGSGRRWWKWPAISLGDFDPLGNNFAELAVHFDLISAMAARANDARALADEGLILVRPFDDLYVSVCRRHDFDSSIARLTSRS
jgi:hypothetical protein